MDRPKFDCFGKDSGPQWRTQQDNASSDARQARGGRAGQPQGLPLQDGIWREGWGRPLWAPGAARKKHLGSHKGCPYRRRCGKHTRSARRAAPTGGAAGNTPGQPQGLPLQEALRETHLGSHKGCPYRRRCGKHTWAATRAAPTGGAAGNTPGQPQGLPIQEALREAHPVSQKGCPYDTESGMAVAGLSQMGAGCRFALCLR
jgi:hypothetical protein